MCYKWERMDWIEETIFTLCRMQLAGAVFKMGKESGREKEEEEEIIWMRTRKIKFFIEIVIQRITCSF